MKNLVALVLTALVSVVAAQSSLPPCDTRNAYTNWHNCFGSHIYPNGSKYLGEFQNGKPHGQGSGTPAGGNIKNYIGGWRDGRRHGQGTTHFADGDKFVGEYLDDIPNGEGTYTGLDGYKYVGGWRDGRRHGKGTEIFASGIKYVGDFKDGQPHGQITYIGPDGDMYVGGYKDGKRHGKGTETLVNGQKYVGDWRDGRPHGQATYTSANGDEYVGGIKDGMFHGQGIYSLTNGDVFVGEFRYDKRHGLGTHTHANGDMYVGEFIDGLANGIGTFTLANGDKFVGEYRGGSFHGRGIATFADGQPPQEGIWENNQFVRAERIPDHIAGRTPGSTVAQRQEPASQPPSAKVPRQVHTLRSTLDLSVSLSPPDPNGVVTFNIVTNSDTASLILDGDELGGRADGRYSVRRFAQVGENNFEVVATDRFGNTQRQTVSVRREFVQLARRVTALNPLSVREARSRDAVAIIIGIEKYRSVPDADFANRDASIFVDYARRALGIPTENIRLMLDEKADSIELIRTFRNWLPTRVNKDKTDVYVFFSGHGLPSEDGDRLYFLPHEVDRDLLDRTAVTQKEVVEAIQRTSPKSVTMFIDSCYSGQSRTGETLLASARPISIAPKAAADFPPNFTVISASAPDQISSSSPELRHGIFSYYLMRGMEGEADANKDGLITVGEMQAYLAERVPRRAMSLNRTQLPQTVGDQSRVLVGR